MKNNIYKLMLVIVLGLLFLGNTSEVQASENVITDGVSIGNMDVSGLNVEWARALVEQKVKEYSYEEFKIEDGFGNSYDTNYYNLGLTWSNPEIIDKAFSIGDADELLINKCVKRFVEYNDMIFPIEFTSNEEKTRELLGLVKTNFGNNSIDYDLVKDGEEFKIIPGQIGVEVNVDKSIKNFTKISTLINGEMPKSNLVVVDECNPRGSQDELAMVKDVLGQFSTTYKTSTVGRVRNIENAASLINGTLLYPGDEFSTLSKLLPFEKSNGYEMGGSFLNGKLVDSLGGGVCQVSSTLYNAVLKAELEITERHNHSMSVSYVKKAMDAAVAGTIKDLKFRNSLEYPIYIEAIATPEKKITFTIYGVEKRPENRKVTFESEIYEVIAAGPEIINISGDLPIGYVEVNSAYSGYKSRLWKVVNVDGVQESKEIVNTSNYKMVPRNALVGMASGDPNANVEMQNAIATGSIDHVRNVAAALAAAAQPAPAQ